jgi:tetratricopeptide (TPR) repeat protein
MPAPIRRVDELGFPLPGSFEDVPDQSSEPSRPKRGWGQFAYRYRWAVLLLLLPILFGSTLVVGARQFVAHWLLNKALVHRERDQLQAALASADRALFWEPDPFECWQEFETRAEIRAELQDIQGSIDDLNETIQRLEDPARAQQYSNQLCEAYAMRGWDFERLGRHREAIADSTTALNLAADGNSRARLLNQRAYIRAIANLELDQGLQDAVQSLALMQNDPQTLDTRAYLLFRLDKPKEALKDIDLAIHQWTQPLAGFRFHADMVTRQQLTARGFQSREIRGYLEPLAVMIHHRGEIRKKLGQGAIGNSDIHQAELMGYNPDRGVY